MAKASKVQLGTKEFPKDAVLSAIREILDTLRDSPSESNRQAIRDYPVNVRVERVYVATLRGGSPATRIIGALNSDSVPTTAKFQYLIPDMIWAGVILTEEEEAILLEFARQFQF